MPGGSGARGVVVLGTLVPELVVDLPGEYVPLAPVAFQQLVRHPRGVLAEEHAVEAVLPPPAEHPRPAVDVVAEHLGVAVCEPRGHRGGGGPEHHFQPGGLGGLEDVVPELEVETAVGGLDQMPRELPDPDHVRAELVADPPEVLLDHLPRPLLGVVVDAEVEKWELALPRSGGRGRRGRGQRRRRSGQRRRGRGRGGRGGRRGRRGRGRGRRGGHHGQGRSEQAHRGH
mmetsp:Transcript_18413/g.45202  ORF Transcript_18413/g.45202 Transcript_18413/m.45202 type:complete len:229 (-) Transcript_18413:40-726(-)